MWILSCPFDAPLDTGNTPAPKDKLLKPNQTYGLGRKGQPLIIAHKRISGDHCSFVVGAFSEDDVDDLSKRPTLELRVSTGRSKGMSVTRPNESNLIIGPGESLELKDKDEIAVLTGIIISVRWEPLVAYTSGGRVKLPALVDGCASLGIHLLQAPNAQITHHLIHTYTSNLSLAPSLVSQARFAKPEWLTEVIKLGTPEEEGSQNSALEKEFSLPPVTKYRPSFSPSLLPEHKTFSTWDPNEYRQNLFRDFRFICFYEKTTINDDDLRETVSRGGGAWEVFDASTGPSKLRSALVRSKAKSDKTTVLVADVGAMKAAVGDEEWREYMKQVESFDLEFHTPPEIIACVLNVKTTPLKPTGASQSQDTLLPRAITPPSGPDPEPQPMRQPSPEPSAPRAPARKLTRRAPSREPSAAPPDPDSAPAPESRPRRKLVRRAINGPPVVTGLEDLSVVLDEPPSILPTQTRAGTVAPSTTTRPKLKRRAGTAAPMSGLSFGIGETIPEEPPVKKFKALFEQSGLDASLKETQAEHAQETATMDEAESTTRMNFVPSSIVPSLSDLREEEEETQASLARKRPLRRMLGALTEDVEMESYPPDGVVTEPPAKRRSVDRLNSVEPGQPEKPEAPLPPARSAADVKPGYTTWTKESARAHAEALAAEAKKLKQAKRGTAPGKPDTDDAFLKAIASTKRGKKTEDDFDREFNKLKIAKPTIQEPDPEDEWAILKEFGDDSNLRGNFMVIVDMEVSRGERKVPVPNPIWDGRPNFKKFKRKVNNAAPRPQISLFPTGEPIPPPGLKAKRRKPKEVDLPTLRELEAMNDLSFPDDDIAPEASQTQARGTKRGRGDAGMDVDDENDESSAAVPARKTRKIPSRAPSAGPSSTTRSKQPAPSSSQTQTTRRTQSQRKNDLFIPSEDEDESPPSTRSTMKTVNEEDQELTLRSTRGGKRATSSPLPPAPPPVRASRSRKLPPVIGDSDSEDDGAFRGFRF